jgi:hypothetical protein
MLIALIQKLGFELLGRNLHHPLKMQRCSFFFVVPKDDREEGCPGEIFKCLSHSYLLIKGSAVRDVKKNHQASYHPNVNGRRPRVAEYDFWRTKLHHLDFIWRALVHLLGYVAWRSKDVMLAQAINTLARNNAITRAKAR